MRFQLTSVRSCAVVALLLLAACDSPQEREAEHLANGKALYESGNLSKAAIEFRNALQINPTGVEAKYFTGLIFEKRGNIPRAVSAFQEVSLQDPNNRDAQLKLGQYAMLNGDAGEASMRADKLIALDFEQARRPYHEGRRVPDDEQAARGGSRGQGRPRPPSQR